MAQTAYTTFSDSVRGYLHIVKNIPCEDASGCWSSPDGSFHIAAVADGHGEKSCVRSGKGARFAVDAAIFCMKSFAMSGMNGADYSDLKENRSARDSIKRLTDTILDSWYRRCRGDLADHPLTEEEYTLAGTYEDSYRKGEKTEHIYGTTLIAALMLPSLLLLIQQGDGRCEVLYADGHADQPIPWDERCYQNVTTSLSDADAAEGFRHAVIDTEKNPVLACCLGSDGIEDSFSRPDGLPAFYANLSCEFAKRTPDDFYIYLEEMMPNLSKNGSGDDVSVAGIADPEALFNQSDALLASVSRYEKDAKAEALTAKITSMQRKHEILRAKAAAEPDDETVQAAYAEYDTRYQSLKKRLAELGQESPET